MKSKFYGTMKFIVAIFSVLEVLLLIGCFPLTPEPVDYEYGEEYLDTNYSYYDENNPLVGSLKKYQIDCNEHVIQIHLEFADEFYGFVYPTGMLTTCKLYGGTGQENVTIDITAHHCGYDALFGRERDRKLLIQWDPILIQDYDVEIPIECKGIEDPVDGGLKVGNPKTALIILREDAPLMPMKEPELKPVRFSRNETVFLYFVIKSDDGPRYDCAVVRRCYAESKPNGESVDGTVTELVHDECSLKPSVVSDLMQMSATSTDVNVTVKVAVLKLAHLADIEATVLHCQFDTYYNYCPNLQSCSNPSTGNESSLTRTEGGKTVSLRTEASVVLAERFR